MNGKDPWTLMEVLEEKLAEMVEAQRAAAKQIEQTGLEIQETDRIMQETARRMQASTEKTDRQFQETDRRLGELGKQIGGLGDKFGSFTEGLALPSMTRILTRDFGMQAIAPRMRVRNNGQSLEVDVLAWSENRDEVFAVEVKSHLREEALDQMRNILRKVPELLPSHRGKKIYGILAAVDIPEDIQEKVLREGIYLARIHDGQFEVQVPEDFQPRAFQA
jgi:hypothetical protein